MSTTTDNIRIHLIGDCEGFAALRDSLAEQPELELVGESTQVGQATTTLAGGHLDCILLASAGTTFPATEPSCWSAAELAECGRARVSAAANTPIATTAGNFSLISSLLCAERSNLKRDDRDGSTLHAK